MPRRFDAVASVTGRLFEKGHFRAVVAAKSWMDAFVQWVAFGGGALASEGVRDEQRKFIKYNYLVANLLINHNVVTMTKALERLAADGHTFDEELISCISPYLTEHINRFGRYTLKRDRVPEPLDGAWVLKMPPRSKVSAGQLLRLCDNPTRILTVGGPDPAQ